MRALRLSSSTYRRFWYDALFAVVVVVALLACKKKGEVVGSCDRRSTVSLQSACDDVFDDDELTNCISGGYEVYTSGTKSEAPCQRAGALAGCKDEKKTRWYFPSKTIRKVEHVASVCTGGTLVAVDDKPLTGVTPAKTASSAEVDTEFALTHYKTKVEAKLKVIEQIAKKLPSPTKKPLTPADKLDNVLHVHEEDLETLGKMPKLDIRAAGSETLSACARVTRDGDTTVADPGTAMSECSRAEHLAVIRLKSITHPKQVERLNQYEPGSASGDVLVFELTDGKLVGSALYTATSSTNLQTKWETFEADLKKDFVDQLGTAWGTAIAKATSKR